MKHYARIARTLAALRGAVDERATRIRAAARRALRLLRCLQQTVVYQGRELRPCRWTVDVTGLRACIRTGRRTMTLAVTS